MILYGTLFNISVGEKESQYKISSLSKNFKFNINFEFVLQFHVAGAQKGNIMATDNLDFKQCFITGKKHHRRMLRHMLMQLYFSCTY